MTIRVFPPGDGLHAAIAINGRSYSAALGSYVDMPDGDALVAGANGWTCSPEQCQVGPTSSRPTSSPSGRGGSDLKGLVYIDTTIAAVVTHDGATWRNLLTGAAV